MNDTTPTESVLCAGTGQYPLERVLLDTVPGVEPLGTCPACRSKRFLRKYRLPPHSAHVDGSVCAVDDPDDAMDDGCPRCGVAVDPNPNCDLCAPCHAAVCGTTTGDDR